MNQEVLQLNEHLSTPMLLLSKVEQLEEQQEYDQALALLSEINLQKFDEPFLYLMKSRVLGKMKRFEEAFGNVDLVLENHPNYEDAYIEKADLYFDMGDFENGKKYFAKWEEVASSDIE